MPFDDSRLLEDMAELRKLNGVVASVRPGDTGFGDGGGAPDWRRPATSATDSSVSSTS